MTVPVATPLRPSPARLRDRLTTLLSDPMSRSSLAIMATTVLTSLLGYAFWLLVARRLGPEAGGAGAAATSALQATVLLASVGAAAALVEWLPRCHSALEWRRRVTAGLLVAVGTALVGGPAVVLVLGVVSDVLPILSRPGAAILFCTGVVVFAAGTVVDYVAISERRSVVLVARSVVLSGLRLPLLFVPTLARQDGATHVLTTWVVAALVSLSVTVVGFGRTADGRTLAPAYGGTRTLVREMGPSFVGQHLITVAAMLAGYLLPVFVVARLSALDNGYFYVTWMLGSVFSIISPAVSTALFAEGATRPDQLPALVRRCVLLVGALLALPMLAYLLGGGLLLGLFGPEYVVRGRWLLVLLTVAAIPDAVTNTAVAVLRATRRLREATLLNTGMLVTCLAGSWVLLPSVGIVAVGGCWLGSQLLGVGYVVLRRRHVFSPATPA